MSIRDARSIATIYALGLIGLGMTVAMATLSGRPPDHFTRDPLAVAEMPFYVGMLSNLTAAAWFLAAGALWAVSAGLWSGEASRRRAMALSLVTTLVTLLGVDDLFMIHEEALQYYANVPETVTIAVYGALAAVIALAYRDALRSTPWRLLISAALFFAASIVVDRFTEGMGWRIVIEDSLKFLGVVGVLAYAVATAQTSFGAATPAIDQ